MSYYPDISECSWCGGDLSLDMELNQISFDTALECHVEECEPYLAEKGTG